MGAKMREGKGYVLYDKKTDSWIARTSVTDDNGKRRFVKRRAKSKTDADVGVASGVERKPAVATAAESRERHYHRVAEFRHVSQQAGGFRPVHHRHVNVHEGERGAVCFGEFDRLAPVRPTQREASEGG